MTDQMKQAREEKARIYGYNNAIYIDKAMLNKKGYQYLEEKPAKDFKEGTDWYRNKVWRSTKEKPKSVGKMIVVLPGHTDYLSENLSIPETPTIGVYNRYDFPNGLTHHSVEHICGGEGWTDFNFFEKWAYWEDLLPDTKGGDS